MLSTRSPKWSIVAGVLRGVFSLAAVVLSKSNDIYSEDWGAPDDSLSFGDEKDKGKRAYTHPVRRRHSDPFS